MRRAPLLALLFASPPAAAAGSWDWPEGVERRYGIEIYLSLPTPLALPGMGGQVASVDQVQLRLKTRCGVGTADPGGWSVLCALEDVGIAAEGVPADQPGLSGALAGVDVALTGAFVEVDQQREGRVARVLLHVTAGKKKKKAVTPDPALSWLVERAFLGLDLVLPPELKPEGPTSWVQMSAGLLSYALHGGVGATRLAYTSTPEQGRLQIHAAGRGVVQTNPVAPPPGSRPGALSLGLAAESDATFDLQSSALLDRSWTVASPEPVSFLDDAPSRAFAQAGIIHLLGEGEDFAAGEDAVWGPSFTPGKAEAAFLAARDRLLQALEATDASP